jgi:hypothetical protein
MFREVVSVLFRRSGVCVLVTGVHFVQCSEYRVYV